MFDRIIRIDHQKPTSFQTIKGKMPLIDRSLALVELGNDESKNDHHKGEEFLRFLNFNDIDINNIPKTYKDLISFDWISKANPYPSLTGVSFKPLSIRLA